jgi:hypothetical protein
MATDPRAKKEELVVIRGKRNNQKYLVPRSQAFVCDIVRTALVPLKVGYAISEEDIAIADSFDVHAELERVRNIRELARNHKKPL